MSLEEHAKRMFDLGVIKGVCLVDSKGDIIWSYPSEWKPPVKELMRLWKSNEPGITIEGIRFSVLERYDDRLVAMNVGGRGGWIVMKSIVRKGYVVFVRIAEGVEVRKYWTDLAKFAEL